MKTWIGSLTFHKIRMYKFNRINYSWSNNDEQFTDFDRFETYQLKSSSLVIEIWLMMCCSAGLSNDSDSTFYLSIFLENWIQLVQDLGHTEISAHHISKLVPMVLNRPQLWWNWSSVLSFRLWTYLIPPPLIANFLWNFHDSEKKPES